MSEGYYRNPQFCLECAWSHSRDVEHHLDDWHKFSKVEEQRKAASELKDKQREIRKQIDEWRLKLKSKPNTEFEEPQHFNPEQLEKCTFRKEQIKPKTEFEPESFRTLCPTAPEKRCALLPKGRECETRIIIGCPTGQWNPKTGRCKVGTQTHVVFHARSTQT